MKQRENFKNLIKSIRIKFNWTQSEMARMMGVTQVAVSNWEKKGSISLKNYLKFCQLQDSLVPPTSTFTDSSILNEHQQDNTPYQTEERL